MMIWFCCDWVVWCGLIVMVVIFVIIVIFVVLVGYFDCDLVYVYFVIGYEVDKVLLIVVVNFLGDMGLCFLFGVLILCGLIECGILVVGIVILVLFVGVCIWLEINCIVVDGIWVVFSWIGVCCVVVMG